MRPLELRLTNFMPYRETVELDLRGISLACIAGDNGAGKSSLIDAMTWALYGKSRAKSDNDLVHLGEEQMEVAFTFSLGDEIFRAIRQRDTSGRGSSALEFQVLHQDEWRPLTGSSIRETQQTIIDTIRLDYDTFSNSALLLQGDADRFTNQTPGERKRILGEILQLEDYDKLEERAKQRVRKAEMDLAKLEAGAEEIERELERKADYESELAEAEIGVQTLGAELAEAQAALDGKKERATGLSFKQQALTDTQTALAKRMHESDLLASRIADLREHGLETWKRDEELGDLLNELEEVQAKIAQVQPSAAAEIEEKLGRARSRIAELEELEREKSLHNLDQVASAENIATLTANNEHLKSEMDALALKIEVLQEPGASCPICDGELTEEHRQEIVAEMQAEGKSKGDVYRTNAEELREAKNEHKRREQTLMNLEAELERLPHHRQHETEFVAELARMRAAQEHVDEWKGQTAKIEQSMEDVKQRYREMAEQQITEAEEQVAKLEAEIGELSAKRDKLRAELEGADELNREIANLNAKITKLDAELNVARQKVGAATQKLEYCQRLEEQKEERKEEHREASQRKAIYEELRLAFGKKGVQAMIIETVIPEIEETANELLGRMTDGRMHVALETQREKRSGDGLMETLDITVSDEQGERPYDLFSGGEQFRINFAVRVALAMVLARRAGANLRTLIMDEGFGSQDANGRNRLVEAINSVAKDFDFIAVVTHVEELREQFPRQILVEKAPAGSLVSVN